MSSWRQKLEVLGDSVSNAVMNAVENWCTEQGVDDADRVAAVAEVASRRARQEFKKYVVPMDT
jgi:hypothetical protein